jgi:hypothetical protein
MTFCFKLPVPVPWRELELELDEEFEFSQPRTLNRRPGAATSLSSLQLHSASRRCTDHCHLIDNLCLLIRIAKRRYQYSLSLCTNSARTAANFLFARTFSLVHFHTLSLVLLYQSHIHQQC